MAFAQTLTVTTQGNVSTSGTVRVDLPALLRIQSWTDPSDNTALVGVTITKK